LLDVLYQVLSQCDIFAPCSIFHNHLFKANQAFPFKAHFVFFSDPSNRAYPLVRSFKAFLLIGSLFLVCLFVGFVCLCPMIDAHRVNVVQAMKSLEECEVEDSEQHHYSLVKGKCVLELLS
jgi:hypothetical protein